MAFTGKFLWLFLCLFMIQVVPLFSTRLLLAPESPITVQGGQWYTVSIQDIGLQNLTFRCQSKNNDLHYHTLNPGGVFKFSFGENFFATTLFFCHFYYRQQQRAMDVFNSHIADACGQEMEVTNVCQWEVRVDGFYLLSHANNGRWEKRYDWQ